MDSSSLISQIITPLLTITSSFVLFHYSQRYISQKNKSDIITSIFAKSKMQIGNNKTINLVQINQRAKFLNFLVHFIFFICFSIITLSIINTSNISSPTLAFAKALGIYLLFYFFIVRVGFGAISSLSFPLEKKIEKTRQYLSFLFHISLYPSISNSIWGIIFYLSFFSYLYVLLFKFSINYLPCALIFFLVSFTLFLMQYIPEFVDFLWSKIIHSDIRMFENIESLIFNRTINKPRVRVWVGGTPIEGEAKEIDRDLVIISDDQQLKKHEIHIRWGAIQAFEIIE